MFLQLVPEIAHGDGPKNFWKFFEKNWKINTLNYTYISQVFENTDLSEVKSDSVVRSKPEWFYGGSLEGNWNWLIRHKSQNVLQSTVALI